MYKIVIVDDENIVREGMRKQIDWPSLGLEYAGGAQDGIEGFELIQRVRPDIAIVDINMPQVNGLELVRMLKDAGNDCEIIVVTGYDDFAYVRESLRLHVSDYILKPLTKDESIEILTTVVAGLDKKREKQLEYEALNEKVNESLPYMRSRYLNGLIYESLYIDSEAIAKMSFNGACQWHGICLLDYDRVLGGSASIHPDERKLTNFALYNLVSELLQNREDCSVFRTDENEIAIVFSYLEESKQAAVLKTKASIAELKKASGQYLKITISAGVGSFVKSLRELSKSYVIAKKAIEYKFFIGNDVIVDGDRVEQSSTDFTGGLATIRSSVLQAVGAREDKRVARELESFYDYMILQKFDKQVCVDEWIKLVAMMLQKFIDMNVSVEAMFGREVPVSETLRQIKSLLNIKQWVHELYLKCSAHIEAHAKSNSVYVARIKEYVAQNYADPELAMQDLSRHVHLSLSYISALFKNEIGRTYIEYVTEYRMQKAAELLRNTTLKTYEIAQQVGFSEPGYFSSVFKKIFNESPSSYRSWSQ
ncbi:response regulator [Paenibacillus sp. B01]|uniref:response regulator n=1 Tax=Paenibacillus sp. B01 TaxID=2660554 RepID=UPI00129BAA9F|nr:response regulator [Paenibacillus sp. B01]QGG55801.1 response regulator [Paenibacillus sp. B01]